MSDDAIFLPNPALHQLYKTLRSEFEEQVEVLLAKPDTDKMCVDLEREGFIQGFNAHIHRFQQLFLLLQDVHLLRNSMLDIDVITAVLTPEYREGLYLPTIRQQEDYMLVGFEEPPINLTDLKGRDYITVATIPLLDEDKVPYNGKSVLVTTVDEETEVCLITHDREANNMVVVWGDAVINAINAIQPLPPSKLN